MNYVGKESSQEVNKIYKTNDLSIFKQIQGNRPPNPRHVSRLASSYKSNGVLQNPIIVNSNMEVIDGQHRLLAAKEAGTHIYYSIVDGYNLKAVQVLNLNQKNWSKRDYMDGYADMGIMPYVKLREFVKANREFNITDCIGLCQNNRSASSSIASNKYRKGKTYNTRESFEEGTWKGRDFKLAQEYADKIKMVKPYYDGYRKSMFVSTMIGMLQNKNFNFLEFLNKIKLYPGKLYDCAKVEQYKLLIEDIYNYRRRNKVSLRY